MNDTNTKTRQGGRDMTSNSRVTLENHVRNWIMEFNVPLTEVLHDRKKIEKATPSNTILP